MDKVAVIGLGNISKRHRANLKKLYPNIKVFSVSASGRELGDGQGDVDEFFSSIDELLKHDIDMAIVASPAPFHIEQAAKLLHVNIPVLIEKPLSSELILFDEKKSIFYEKNKKIAVAYNLRFMPSAIATKKILNQKKLGRIYHVAIEVGQYLPDWRPAMDYRKSVSARKELGGGVLLELSHELDYLQWLFGKFDTVYCIALNSEALDINVEDNVNALFYRTADSLSVSLHMDFLQREPVRTCKIIGEHGTLIWDVLHNSVCLYDMKKEKTMVFDDPNYDRNQMYLDELVHFEKQIKDEVEPSVDVAQALETLKLIEAMKKSSAIRQVVNVGDIR